MAMKSTTTKAVHEPDITEMFGYVKTHADFEVTDEEFDLVEAGFRDYWNQNSGKMVYADDFKDAAWQALHPAVKYYYPRAKSDAIISLILAYMNSIGQYGFEE